MRLNPSTISITKRLLVGRTTRPLKAILTKLAPADLAALLLAVNEREKRLLFDALLAIDKLNETLQQLPEPQLVEILQKVERHKLLDILAHIKEDDAAFYLGLLEATSQEEILASIDPLKQQRFRQLLNYPKDSAGRLMHLNPFCLSGEMSAQEGIELLRSEAQHIPIYYVYVVDKKNKLIGVVSLRNLITAPVEKNIQDFMKREVITVRPDHSSEEVAQIVSHYDYIAVPVTDNQQRLVGLITVDDVVDIIQEQATADIYATAGLQESDRVYSPAERSIRSRVPWMVLNLLLAALASSVVALFEDTMSELIILASLKNIVAGLGGNTAVQTLTVVTRGLATNDFEFISYKKAILKEMMVGVSIGAITGILAGTLVYFWKGNPMVSVVIAVSMLINSFVASGFGATIPVILKRLGRDPAVGSGVLATVITDIFGFFSFLGIATLGLKFFS